MTYISRPTLLLLLLAAALAVVPTSTLEAEDTSSGSAGREASPTRPVAERHDYSRFSDGPRRVPRRRGRSLVRAEELGLGSLQSARKLLRRAPEPRWREAAGADEADELELAWPVEGGRFGRGFGFVRRTRPDLRHNGVDIAAPEGAVVRAVADGIVAYSDNGIRGFGNCVMIIHPNGWVSLYAHHYRNTVQPGWRVTRGERIGFVGKTGIARGPHLHFELRRRGRPIDPARYFVGQPTADDPRAEPSPAAFAHASAVPAHADGHAHRSEPTAPEAAHRDASPASRGLAIRLLRHPADEALLEGAGDRIFSNLLWPLRGGEIRRGPAGGRQRMTLSADEGTAVRASADGLVVLAGERLPGRGTSVVILHKNGWVTVYGGVKDVAVEAGAAIRRGEWLGFTSSAPLKYELVDGGRPRDPAPLLVQVPGA